MTSFSRLRGDCKPLATIQVPEQPASRDDCGLFRRLGFDLSSLSAFIVKFELLTAAFFITLMIGIYYNLNKQEEMPSMVLCQMNILVHFMFLCKCIELFAINEARKPWQVVPLVLWELYSSIILHYVFIFGVLDFRNEDVRSTLSVASLSIPQAALVVSIFVSLIMVKLFIFHGLVTIGRVRASQQERLLRSLPDLSQFQVAYIHDIV